MRLLVLVTLVSASALAQDDIYRWVDADGVAHFTDDASQIPRGVKKQKTRGAPVSTMTMIDVDNRDEPPPQRPVKVAKTEAQWRAEFKEARAQVAELEKQITEDKAIIEPSGLNTSGKFSCYSGNYNVITGKPGPDACGLMIEDAEWARMRKRLDANRSAIKTWRTRLHELEIAAANAGIPTGWRE